MAKRTRWQRDAKGRFKRLGFKINTKTGDKKPFKPEAPRMLLMSHALIDVYHTRKSGRRKSVTRWKPAPDNEKMLAREEFQRGKKGPKTMVPGKPRRHYFPVIKMSGWEVTGYRPKKK